ncbi:MAG: FAD-dependent oxidoreductase [Bdellovibrionales bacterium]|nr:FAD-dependent oxidoreductase [Bdellovibrionales bacterium]
MIHKTDVLVIGGGVIGAACALELAGRGAKVTLLERGEPGFGCSYGNAGWITPCFAFPLPMPGMILKSVRWLLDPESPLYIRPQASPVLFRWLAGFLFSMRAGKARRAVESLTEISKVSLDFYRTLDAGNPGLLSFRQGGLLMAAQTPGGVADAVREMDWVAPHGIPGRKVSEEEARALEPALTGRILGGVHFPEEAHLEPLAAVQTMIQGAIAKGAVLFPGAEVYDFEESAGSVSRVLTTRGPIEAKQVIVAAGTWSPVLARRLRVRVPVLGGKGYALTVQGLAPAPRAPIMLIERKIAVTPRAGSVRLAGTLELVNQDFGISPRRVQAILKGARTFLNLPENPEVRELWRGLRPCTPDGVPIIGFSPRQKNVLVATGHQMLGLQSAPGTARLAADLLLGATPTFDPHPFRADRF